MTSRAELQFDLFRLRVPLTRPYRLAFGPVVAYDTVLVRCRRAGSEGWGEATLLTGYTSETIESSWSEAGRLAVTLAALDGEGARRHLLSLQREHPFTATAFCTAIEMAERAPVLMRAAAVAVPILGLLNATEPDAIAGEIEQLLADGYRTIKVKVGFDPRPDADRVATVQAMLRDRARIRLDANQGYSPAQAREFLGRLDPRGIELFEQPCAAGDWPAHAEATADAPVPVMLDESIYDEADIDRAAAEGAAQFVKVKLMKFVSVERLGRAIERIRAHGMTPVLGNGVAGDIGCWMEACVAADRIDNAGEMNGFLKPVRRCLSGGMRFAGGHIHIPANWEPRPDPSFIDAFRVA